MVGCPRFLKKAAVLFGIMGFTAQGLFKTGTALAETSEASSSVSSETPSQPRWACCITNRNNKLIDTAKLRRDSLSSSTLEFVVRQASAREFITVFQNWGVEIAEAQRGYAEKLSQLLAHLEGRNFGSFEENANIAKAIASILDRLHMALACPKPGCGVPSRLRCSKPGRSKTGQFQFEHYIIVDGKPKRTNHFGSNKLPALAVIPAQSYGK